MINREIIDKCIYDCDAEGYSNISVRDISYFYLKKEFQDGDLAYSVIFGDSNITRNVYESREDVQYLREYMNKYFKTSSSRTINTKKDFEDISFEENKESLLKLLEELKEAKACGEIEAKDAIKIEADIRTKLNDKFKVSESEVQQYVLVQPRFNHICEWTQRECYLMTKEYAMEHFGLVEK